MPELRAVHIITSDDDYIFIDKRRKETNTNFVSFRGDRKDLLPSPFIRLQTVQPFSVPTKFFAINLPPPSTNPLKQRQVVRVVKATYSGNAFKVVPLP